MFRATTSHTVAIFRQINKGAPHIHHDALEFPDGEIVLLTRLCEGQKATVLTLPTQPKTAAEAEAQQRVAYVGWHWSSWKKANKSTGRSLPRGLLLLPLSVPCGSFNRAMVYTRVRLNSQSADYQFGEWFSMNVGGDWAIARSPRSCPSGSSVSGNVRAEGSP
jgi:hypothetical protein